MKATWHPSSSPHRPGVLALTLSRTNIEALLRHLDEKREGRALMRAGALAENGRPEEPEVIVTAAEDADHYPGGSVEGRAYSPLRNHAGEQLDLLGNEGRPS